MRHPTCPVCGYDFQHTTVGYESTRSPTVLGIVRYGYPFAWIWFFAVVGIAIWLNVEKGEAYHPAFYIFNTLLSLAPGVTMKLIATYSAPVEVYDCPTCRFQETR